MIDGDRTALYRLYDDTEQLLYVGVAQDPWKRWRFHRRDKEWWGQVSVREIEWVDSREAALRQEAVEIRTRRPVHNIHPGWTWLDPDALAAAPPRKKRVTAKPLDWEEAKAMLDALMRKAGKL
ncbi:GIY-YIG nuclease family protein [Streptomyces sp. NPDC006339]|uniref:GIY-YIG nuclease family protein n=1 Tax=Streptomyces sp. NPDC006339 TaxID=3156755 RepID=UPI0033BEF243